MLAMIWHKIVCWFLKNYQDLKRFATQEHRIVFILTFRCAKQFYVPNMQEQSKAGKKSEINRQTLVIWWLNSRTYRSVWYLFSCKHLYHSDLISTKGVGFAHHITIYSSLRIFRLTPPFLHERFRLCVLTTSIALLKLRQTKILGFNLCKTM